MIVSCPECSARYRLADDAIPPEGRAMRCAACKHRWYEMGPGDAPPPRPAPTPEQAAWTPDPEPTTPARDRHRVRKTILAIALSAALTAGVVAVRQPDLPPLDLSRIPWLAQLIDPPAAPKSPLQIAFTVDTQPVGDGRTLFAVRGEIVNPTRTPQSIPPLEGRLVDRDNTIAYRWPVDPGRPSLPPGGRATFDASAIGDGSERAVISIAG